MAKPISDQVSEQGTAFSVLFYFYFAFFIIPVSIYFISSVVQVSAVGIIISSLWLGVAAYFFAKKNLIPLLIVMFLQFPMQFLYIPFLEAISPVFSFASTIYVFSASLIYALVMTRLCGKVCSQKQFLNVGVWFSSALAVVFVANMFSISLVQSLSNMIRLSGESGNVFQARFSSPIVEFIIAYCLFSGVFVYNYIKKDGKTSKILYFIIPLAVFGILYAISHLMLHQITLVS